jgi:putative FmdB family regulatory protein
MKGLMMKVRKFPHWLAGMLVILSLFMIHRPVSAQSAVETTIPQQPVVRAVRRFAMPLYDYLCNACDESFEVRTTIKEKEAGLDVLCPRCDSHKTRQILSIVQQLRGGKDFSPSGCGPNSGPRCFG